MRAAGAHRHSAAALVGWFRAYSGARVWVPLVCLVGLSLSPPLLVARGRSTSSRWAVVGGWVAPCCLHSPLIRCSLFHCRMSFDLFVDQLLGCVELWVVPPKTARAANARTQVGVWSQSQTCLKHLFALCLGRKKNSNTGFSRARHKENWKQVFFFVVVREERSRRSHEGEQQQPDHQHPPRRAAHATSRRRGSNIM